VVAETARVQADGRAFTRLLENLLKNALDHGGETVTVGRLSDGFYLADDGPGIPEDVRQEVFDPGYSTKAETDGTGFGLTSTHQIALAHGWKIAAVDGNDGGARFEVTGVEFVE
jgi:PAS/PAC sensor hybrid histidine kinase (EC 2.7.13.3)